MSMIPEPPAGSTDAAVRVWHEVVDSFEPDRHELMLLVQAVRPVSLLDRLDDELRDAPVLVDDQGAARSHTRHPSSSGSSPSPGEDLGRAEAACWCCGRPPGGRPSAP